MAGCSGIAGATAKFWQKYKEELQLISSLNPHLSAAMKAAKTADKMIRLWNKLFGKQSQLTIGPRKLPFSKKQTGYVYTQRAFVAERSTKKKAVITFKKLGGNKKKTTVKFCIYDHNNKHKEIKKFTVTRKHDKGKTWKATVGAKKLVSVLITGSVGTNRLHYSLRLKES
jgi:hypothetical protein